MTTHLSSLIEHSLVQMISDLNTYLTKAIPDTRLTIEKYADAKFEYLVCRFRDWVETSTNSLRPF